MTNLAWVLFGGLLVVGVLAAVGAFGGGSTKTATSAVREVAATTRTVSDSSATSGDLDAESLYSDTASGVVEITAKTTAAASGGESESFRGPGGSPFGEEGGVTPEGGSPFGEEGGSSEATATGSGFIVDDEGTVVTAAHVVDEATSVEVKLADGTSRSAEVLGEDDATDLAVIRFDASGLELHPLQVGSSSALNVGAEVAAIGAPFNYAWSISTGIVSGLDRTIEAPNGFTVAHAIQTDAAVNPGNSGGPLLNSAGEVIGVVDQIATDGSSDQSSGVGFAVPSDLVTAEVQALAGGEDVEHAYLGVATGDAEGSAEGALIGEVVAGSPAAEADLEAGDVITALDGVAIGDSSDLVAAIAGHQPGDKVELEVERDSGTKKIEVQLGTQPAESSLGG